MATPSSSRKKSNGSDLATYRSHSLSSSSFASSTSSSFSSSTFFARATSPTRANLYGHHHANLRGDNIQHRSSPSVRFSIDNRPISPNRSISFSRQINRSNNATPFNSPKRTCACSPTTHPGSFRCALHKRMNNHHNHKTSSSSYHSSSTLNYRRSAMTNSLVRIGGVEGELVKRALTALIRPSSHQQRRRAAFEPRPSRLSAMSKADDL
ncbi:putative Serine-rich protein-related [Melia azedarach]|uniref:Serine-rich protein-related n=1 Tax=Melia azedarach TaxID=155640 RepID=A0ACC1Y4D3_MELAZ|nr:putative Serine-rich protein-related [Melia azedarach]